MNLPTPRWWYQEDGGPARITRALLTPVSWLWIRVTARRIRTTLPIDPGAPVICVGNLTMGGTGKTPVVRAILKALRARGIAAEGLSRGHGGRLAGPLKVDPLTHGARDVGDEPLMLAAGAPFWIARDRIEGAKAAVAGGAGVLVLDDGHQNPALKKALSLIVVDGETRDGEWPFGDGAVFPAGPMREPLAVGLTRASSPCSRPCPCWWLGLSPTGRRPQGRSWGSQAWASHGKWSERWWPPGASSSISPPTPTTRPTAPPTSASSPPAPRRWAPGWSPRKRTGCGCPRNGGRG